MNTGVLTLTGTATVAEYEAAIRSIQYEDANPTPAQGILVVNVSVFDGEDTSNVASKEIHIVSDLPPRAGDDAGTVAEGGSVVIDLLANDTDNENSLDLNSIVITSGPSNGSVVVNGDGTITYTHDGSETLSDTFSYTVKDTNGNTSSPAQVYLTVTNVNDAPLITSDGGGSTADISIFENTTAVTTLTANDAESDSLAFSISGGADAALFSINSTTGELTFVSAPNFEEPADADGDNVYVVTVQVADGNGGFDTQAISVTVTDADEIPPVVTIDSLSTSDNTPQLTGTVDDPTATVEVTVNGTTYTATNNGDGTWTLADNNIAPALADGTYDVSRVGHRCRR